MMKQFSLVTIFLFFSVPIINGCSEQKQNEFAGVYTSRLPRIGPLLEIMERKHKAQIEPMQVRMIYLRKDNSYVLGGCDYQVKEAGKYRIRGDSVYFTNRYSLAQKTFLPDRTQYYDQKNKSIYQLEKNEDTGSMSKYKYKLIILELGFVRSHMGFLRDQEMSLDSIMTYYKLWSLEEQMDWLQLEWNRRSAVQKRKTG